MTQSGVNRVRISRAAIQLLKELEEDGVELSVHGENISYKGRPTALGAARKQEMLRLKSELMALLCERQVDSDVIHHAPKGQLSWVPYGHQASMIDDPDVHNILCSMVWHGVFDRNAAQAAFDQLLWRHSVLRAHYVRSADSSALALTKPSLGVTIDEIDLRESPPVAQQPAIIAIEDALIAEPFDLYTGPLTTCTVVRLSERYTCFFVTVHHSLCDAISAGIVSSDLRTLYQCAISQSPSPLDPLPLEYCDVAQERSRWQDSIDALPHVDYWRRIISGSTEMFWLPHDRVSPLGPRDLRPDAMGHIAAADVERLRIIAISERTTLPVMFSALVAVGLACWAGSTEVFQWICHNGRFRPEHQRMVGCFIDHWLLRVDLSGNPSFLETLRRVHQRSADAAPHLSISLHRIIPELQGLHRGTLHPATVLNFMPFAKLAGIQHASRIGDRPPRLTCGLSKESPLAMIVNCVEFEHDILWAIKYSSYLFEDDTIKWFSDSLSRIANRISVDPHTLISTLTIENFVKE